MTIKEEIKFVNEYIYALKARLRREHWRRDVRTALSPAARVALQRDLKEAQRELRTLALKSLIAKIEASAIRQGLEAQLTKVGHLWTPDIVEAAEREIAALKLKEVGGAA